MAYTSDSEFDAETRVQITNEVPPMDIYDGLHSVLKLDKSGIWKWLLGFSNITTGLEFKGNYDADDDEEPLKIVNGTVAEEYGPKSKQVWDSTSNSYVTENPTNQTRMEIDGVLLPENDLFLHEIYRYLSVLYPDHPDWVKLLTHTEIVDAFENAAAMVDYKPDDKFFLLVAQNLEKSSTEDDAVAREELKLLLRNLTNNSYRRKFYGSSSGLRMLAAGIEELSSSFPMGTYLPLKPEKITTETIDGTETAVIHNSLSEDIGIEVENTPANHNIDIFDPNYKKMFRIIDWDGTSRDITTESNSGITLKAITIPGMDKSFYELFDQNDYASDNLATIDDLNTKMTMVNSMITASQIYIADINDTDEVDYCDIVDGTNGFEASQSVSASKAYSAETSKVLPIIYTNLYNYGNISGFEAIIKEALEEGAGENINNFSDNWAYQPKVKILTNGFANFNTFFTALASVEAGQSFKKVQCTLSPFNKSCVILEPTETIKIYNDNPVFEKDETGTINVLQEDVTHWPSDLALQQKDIICNSELGKDSTYRSVSQVAGLNKGKIKVDGTVLTDKEADAYLNLTYGQFDINDNSVIADQYHYGMIITTENDKKVVVSGSMQVEWEQYLTYTRPAHWILYLECIPEKKDDNLCAYIYSDFTEVKNKIASLQVMLTERNDDDTDYKYTEEYRAELQEQIDEYTAYLDECRKNREYFTETATYKDSDGNTIEYSRLTVNKNCAVDQVYTVNMGDNGLEYYDTVFMVEAGTISYVDFGSVSILPLADKDSYAFKKNLSEDDPTYDVTTKEAFDKYYKTVSFSFENALEEGTRTNNLYFAVLKDDLFEIDQPIRALYPSIMDDDMYDSLAYNLTGGTTNITCNENSTVALEIEATADFDSDSDDAKKTLTFTGDENLRKYETLTTGDTVEGNGIPSSTYIVSKQNNSIILSNELVKSGTFTYKFNCAVEAYPSDISEDFENYKTILSNNGSTTSSDPFDNGLYGSDSWPAVHNAYIDGLVDPQDFTPWNDDTNCFDDVMKYLYGDKIEGKDFYALIPSSISLNKNTFFEIDIQRLINLENRNGSDVNLMNVEWLDYLTENANNATQASNLVNIGTNLMMQTDMSGYYSLVSGRKYTDPDLHIYFQTFDWTADTIPAYAQIGSGGSSHIKWFQSVDDIAYPNVYGADFYDKERATIKADEEEMELSGGEQRKRSVYSKSDNHDEVETEVKNEGSVENLLAEVPLGEYDIQKAYTDNGITTTTVSATFYKQSFGNLCKKLDENDIKVLNEELTSTQLLSKSTSVLTYKGNYTPAAKGSVMSYPSDPSEGDYYTIYKGSTVTLTEGSQVIPDSTILIYLNGTWRFETCEFGGLLCDNEKVLYEENATSNTGYSSLWTLNYDHTDEQLNELSDEIKAKYGVDNIKAILHYMFVSETKLYSTTYPQDSDVEDFMAAAYNRFLNGNLAILGFLSIGTTPGSESASITYKALIWTDSTHPVFIELNSSLFAASIQFNSSYTKELAVFTDSCDEYYLKNDDGNYVSVELDSILTIIEENQNTFELPRRCVTDGSYDIQYTLDPHFISEGYLYADYTKDDSTVVNKPIEDDEHTVNFCVSQSPIYYDDTNLCFYTTAKLFTKDGDSYVATDTEAKVALKFKEQRFFKDVQYLIGEYRVDEVQSSLSTDTEEIVTFSALSGSNFDVTTISPSDRVLQLEEVTLRSIYQDAYEPVLYSNYSSIAGEIHGIDENGNLFIAGYREGDETYSANKGKFASEVQKFIPMIVDTSGDEAVEIALEDTLYNYEVSTAVYEAPVLRDPVVKKSFTDDSIGLKDGNDVAFAYYKNYLILEGRVDYAAPSFIESNGSSFFSKALKKISSGDSVIAVAALSVDNASTRSSIMLTGITETPKLIRFAGSRLVAVASYDKVYYSTQEIDDISSVSEVAMTSIELSVYKDNANVTADAYPTPIGLDYINGKWNITFELPDSLKPTEVVELSISSTGCSDKFIFRDAKNHSVTYADDDVIPVTETTLDGIDQDELQLYTELADPIYMKAKDICFKSTGTVESFRYVYVSSSDVSGDTINSTAKINAFNDLNEYGWLTKKSGATYTRYSANDNGNVLCFKETYTESNNVEGPYIEDVSNATRNCYATNGDIEAYIQGQKLFVKSSTKILTKNDDGTYTDNNQLSDKSHWKCGTIPQFKDALKAYLNTTTVDDIYTEVNNAVTLLVKEMNANDSEGKNIVLNTTTSDMSDTVKAAVYAAIKDYTVLTFDAFKAMLTTNSVATTASTYTHKCGMTLTSGHYTFKKDGTVALPVTTNAGNFDYEDMYRSYAYFILENMCAMNGHKSEITSSDVEKIMFTNTYMLVQLKDYTILSIPLDKLYCRDDIEDDDNWTILELPADGTYAAPKNASGSYNQLYSTKMYADCGSNGIQEWTEYEYETERRTFTITASYVKDDSAFFVGYYNVTLADVKSSTATAKGSALTSTETTNLETAYGGVLSNTYKLPMVYYTTNGMTLDEIPLKSLIEADTSSITVKEGTNTKTYSMKSSNIEASAVNMLNGVLLVSFLSLDNPSVAFDKVLKVYFDDYGLPIGPSGTSNIPEIGLYDYTEGLAFSNQFKIDGGEGIFFPSNNQGIAVLTNKNAASGFYFDVISNSSISVPKNLKVTYTSELGFRLNSSLRTADASSVGSARVLLAIKTDAQISDQSAYLDPAKLQQYVGSTKKFKVPLFESVDNSTIADKMYSLRNTIRQAQEVNGGYPSIEEDENTYNRKFYKYDEITNGSEIIYQYQKMTNAKGDPVYLCTEDGTELITSEGYYRALRRPVTMVNLYNALSNPTQRELLQAPIPVLEKPSSVEESMDYLLEDSTFTSLIKDKNVNITFGEWSYTDITEDETNSPELSVPYVRVNSGHKLADFKSQLLEITKSVFDEYKAAAQNGMTDATYEASIASDTTKYAAYAIIKGAIDYIASVEGRWGNLTNHYTNWWNRLSYKVIGKKYYLYDNKEKVYMLNHVRYISSPVSISYTHNEDMAVMPVQGNVSMRPTLVDGKYVLDLDNDLPVNAIYLPIKGYGGLRNISYEKWTDGNLPWVNDPQAFYDAPLYNSLGEKVYICDETGNILKNGTISIEMKAPKYGSFKDLVSSTYNAVSGLTGLGYVVENDSSNVLSRGDSDILTISGVDSKGTYIQFNESLSDSAQFVSKTSKANTVKGAAYNDRNSHYFKIKILSIADTPTDYKHKNDPDYFVEVTKDEIETFPPNRVYFNPEGIPQPPVTYNSEIYGADNSYAFYQDSYKNANDKYIFECDENGYYIGYSIGTKAGYVNIQSTDFVSKDDVHLTKYRLNTALMTEDTFNSALFIPRAPIYDTCEQWFKNEFYIKSSEKNPFWQIIRIYPKFNRRLKRFEAISSLYEWKKSSATMGLFEVDSDDTYVTILPTSTRKIYGGFCNVQTNASYIDLQEGVVRFILSQPSEKFRTTEHFVKYGISYKNSFEQTSGLKKNIWNEKQSVNMDSFIDVTYTVNSKEDLANPMNKDAAIVQVTEMALLDKDRKIIAYSVFPPIEYRTDTQHVSFTCFINNSNLVVR